MKIKHLIGCLSIGILSVALLTGCGQGGNSSIPAAEPGTKEADIQAYLKSKGLFGKAQKTASGLYYVMEKEGEGQSPTIEHQVKVHYHGTLLDETVFDSSVDRGTPIEFPLRGVVKGWQEGIPLLKPGGKAKLIIPPNLGYGSRPAGGGKIPANSVLVFDVELIETIDMAAKALEQANKDDVTIKNHLAANGLEAKAKRTDSGIYYVVEKEGKGESPQLSSTVKVHYHGTLLDGTVFDSSVDRGTPAEFQLGGVVKGWQESVPLLKPGGKGKFFIPSGLAYGERGAGQSIPPNSVLAFDIELLEVK